MGSNRKMRLQPAIRSFGLLVLLPAASLLPTVSPAQTAPRHVLMEANTPWEAVKAAAGALDQEVPIGDGEQNKSFDEP